MAIKTGSINISSKFQRQTSGFYHAELEETVSGNCTTTNNRKWQFKRFGRQSCHFGLSNVVAITLLHFHQAGYERKFPICCWNFNAVCHSFRDISISGFGGHFRLSVIIGIVQRHSLRASQVVMSKTKGLPLEFW